MISVIVDKHLKYPNDEFHFSPDEAYPEYQLSHISPRPNPVYAAVRECFAQVGLDRANLGRAEWNPLGAFIKPGQQVFALCNFVYHKRPSESERFFQAKCTHASVLRAVVDYMLIAVGPAGKVLVGNAALQSCHWDSVLEETGSRAALDFYEKRSLPVYAKDLRLFIAERSLLGDTTHTETLDQDTNATVTDLGQESLLAELYQANGRNPGFRVSDYDAKQMEVFHGVSRHKYVIHRFILESDVIFCLPKLKTHQKVGITCSLKGFVGITGRKDCLAHHRFGSPAQGGDEYPDGMMSRDFISRFHDWVQKPRPAGLAVKLLQVVDRSVRRLLRLLGATQAGGWYGNDTAWRMALDLARIALYADRAGQMTDAPHRTILSLIDGVVGGEGEGPLSPRPVSSGALLFSDNVAVADFNACRLMGYDPDKIPLVREAFRRMRYPLAERVMADERFVSNRVEDKTRLRSALPRGFRPPAGWGGRIEAIP